ncbi:hypothetical protein [Streptodolium elevatio]
MAIVVFVLGLLYAIGKGCDDDPSSDNSYATGGATRTAMSGSAAPRATSSGGAPCPARIAGRLPSGSGAQLVKAFRTANKQITLCLTREGKLFYFGEFSDQREPGIAMPAQATGGGYEASNPPYRYVIHGNVVTVYNAGTQVGEETLTPLPSPS